jgi:tRNA 2-thiouridine synthesizing protein B
MLLLVDKPMAEIALRTAADEPTATVVLLQDGVLLDPDVDCPVYAVARDLEVRGITPPADVEPIRYDELIERIVTEEVRSFV